MKATLASLFALASKVAQSELMKYLFEIFIVFLGVYLAFLLTDYQESLRERDIRVQHYESLALELRLLANVLKFEENKLHAHMKVVEEINQGNRPRIPPSDLLFVYTGSLVESAFNSRHFEALDSDIVREIIQGSFGLKLLEEQIDSFNKKATVLLPTLANHEQCCYGEDGQLLNHWQWYPRIVQEIYELNQQAYKGITENAIPDLRENIRKMRNLPPTESSTTQARR